MADYAWLFRNLPVLASAQDADGSFIDVSDAFAARLGYERDELIGLDPVALATPESEQAIVHEYRALLRRTGHAIDVPVELKSRGGERIALVARTRVERSVGPNRALSVSVYREADDVARKFADLYRAMPAMLHTVDRAGRILEVSDRWLRKLGFAREEVVGRPVTDFFSDSTREQLAAGRLDLLFDVEEHTNQPREMVTRSGDVLELLASAEAERDAAGEIVRLLVASKDVTEMNRAERQLRETLVENGRLRRRLERERDYLREEVNISMNFGRIVGSSQTLQAMLSRIEAVAQTSASVLIQGESGTGKELVAHAIHARSPRAERPLVKVNCASIPKELFESEFFGHVKGAFTGAVRDRVGRFQLANGGTLFLDEVSEIPLELQGKLLRVLQEQEFERVGEDRTRSVDVRVIAATNRDLKAFVDAGRFREDLYYRLGVFPLEVPPLRERGDDVLQLASHFLRQICTDFGREPMALTPQQGAELRAYDWPGNVRELKNVLERGVILARDGLLQLDLRRPTAATAPRVGEAVSAASAARPYLTEQEFRERHRDNLRAALEHAGWRVSGKGGAAELLGLPPTTLAHRMRSLDVHPPPGHRRRRAS